MATTPSDRVGLRMIWTETSMTISIPTLTTERLVMGAPEMRDFEAYAEFRVPGRVKWQGGPNTREKAFDKFCSFIGMWQLRGDGPWLVTDKETGTALGIVGFFTRKTGPNQRLPGVCSRQEKDAVLPMRPLSKQDVTPVRCLNGRHSSA